MASAVALALCIAGSWLFLEFAHAGKWFLASVAVSLGAVFAGRLLGERVWPVLGAVTAALVLRAYSRWGKMRGARLVISPYADFVPGPLRQTWEAMAFASGLALLGAASLLYVLELDSGMLPWLTVGALVLCAALTVAVVPQWLFARLGLRLWEPERFIVRSIAESYSGLVRVSNGTLLVAAILYGVNVLMLGRVPRLESGMTVAGAVAAVLVLSLAFFGTATAYYRRHEEYVVKAVAAEARRLGFTAVRAPLVREP